MAAIVAAMCLTHPHRTAALPGHLTSPAGANRPALEHDAANSFKEPLTASPPWRRSFPWAFRVNAWRWTLRRGDWRVTIAGDLQILR